jgi:hypothetical protein
VCGAGAAGLAAAISAARRQADVLLVEAGQQLGGTVAGALIHTLAGLYDSAGEIINDGLPRELVERLVHAEPRARRREMGRLWVLQACPSAYRDTVTGWVQAERRIRVVCGARVTQVATNHKRINELEISRTCGTRRIRPGAVVDATGTAEIARLVDPSLVIDDHQRAAGGWVFRIRGIARDALSFPKGVGVVRALREAAKAGALPATCAHAWIDAGIDEDEAFVKLMVPLADDWREPARLRQIESQARASQTAVFEFLKQRPDFAGCEVAQTGALGVRDGGRIRGRYTLTGEDVRRARTFPDAVCRCAWPIEYWHAQRGVSIEYLPAGAAYEIPMRSLQVADWRNFWTAGKCLSADREAHASARVVGACWAMGQAAGAAAATAAMDTCED